MAAVKGVLECAFVSFSPSIWRWEEAIEFACDMADDARR